MSTATENHITRATMAWQAIGFYNKSLAIEADIQALSVIRSDADKVARTEDQFRGLIAKQRRMLRLARRIERRLEAAQ